MKQQEFLNILGYLKDVYGNNSLIPSSKTSIAIWYEELKHHDYSVCFNAIREYVKINEFPPTIAAINKICLAKQGGLMKTADEAWDSVYSLVSRYGYNGYDEVKKKLDPCCLEVIKGITWWDICRGDTLKVEKDFKSRYNKAKTDYEKAALSAPAINQSGVTLIG